MVSFPAIYTGLPRPARGMGIGSLQLPFHTLSEEFVLAFLKQTLSLLLKGRPLRDTTEFLTEHGLSDDVIMLKGVFDGYQPAEAKWDGTLSGLNKLLRDAAGLCFSDGPWNEDRETLRDVRRDAASGLMEQLTELVGHVHRKFGLRSAYQVSNRVRRALQQVREALRATGSVSERQAVSAVEADRAKVASIARRPGALIRCLEKLSKKFPVSLFLNQRQQTAISRFARTMSQLQRSRFASLEREARKHLLDDLLGNDAAGRLGDMESALGLSRELYVNLITSLKPQPQTQTSAGFCINIVEELHQILDSLHGQSLADLYFEKAAQAGCTPALLAERLRKRPLKIGGRSLWHDQWIEVGPTVILALLERVTRRYLGLDEESQPFQPEIPQTAGDHIASIGLLHEKLRPLLVANLPALLDRSRPFVEVCSPAGIEENIQAFLYTYPKDRAEWLELLRTHVQVAERQNTTAYSVRHPFRVDLLQYQIAAPVGAMSTVQSWSVLACQAERRGLIVPHIDRRQFPEIRLLADRTRSLSDCRELFTAAASVGIITAVGSHQRYAINRDDERLQELFSPSQWSPAQVTGETLQALLKHDIRFTDFLTRLFPEQTDLRASLHRLKKETDVSQVTGELSRRNILSEVSLGRFHVSTTFLSKPVDAPCQLLKRTPGPLVGLPEEEFLTQMLKHDLLYSVIFFGVQDAWQRGWISENDTPSSVIEYTQNLL